ncbi:hypothetical protein NIES2135_38340 [Leptolyngbya boryana NIES-2135]|jgi:hypothetical protein|uniref:Uncharacterized protein n=1 Tax=Leptolyngbya boryana NIES-2135 TaxID=1973484 RepID=A0A1Z4JJP6_LEPBY|nr:MULTISPECIES: hypothetical protein [Leptolyngbya]BAY56972.1 hypothetical protein NIES2135_38340 [Leptolyngbya boryana NIES-2135]MBD2369049.1 hypothetical protein [Leptolyngbya sp. FACHB-161]MBD2377693.1 hypothetical protein [Leptolyngbya sp. FACHB-238]MBD2399857.1 hypothetical protein [Leptolyngbya sp. FACHB-239]MBD2406063.1 hypothetical protein [Leptolyngbya sp. FACHB-402]
MSNSERHTVIHTAILEALGLTLTEEENKVLATEGSISFDTLLKSRSLSEVGMALIRADALNRLPKRAESSDCQNCKDGFCFNGTCIRINTPPLELSVHID